MHKSRLGALIIDCQSDDLFIHAKFWGAALGREPENSGEQLNRKYIRLNGRQGEARVILQSVEHPSRVHIDIEADDIEAEVARLETLGAKRIKQVKTWWVMEAPTGQCFCIVGPQGSWLRNYSHELNFSTRGAGFCEASPGPF